MDKRNSLPKQSTFRFQSQETGWLDMNITAVPCSVGPASLRSVSFGAKAGEVESLESIQDSKSMASAGA